MTTNQPLFLSHECSSIKEFQNQALRWNLDFKKITPGKFNSTLKVVDSERIQIAETNIRGTMLQYCVSPEGFRTIILSANDMQFFKWNGYDIDSSCLLIPAENNTFQAITHDLFHVYTIAIRNDYIEELVEKLQLKRIKNKLGKNEAILSIDKNYLHLINSYLDTIFSDFKRSMKISPDNDSFQKLSVRLPEILLEYIDRNDRRPIQKRTRKTDTMVLKMLDFYMQHPKSKLGVRDFCKKFNIQQRTLEYGVKEYFNVSPKSLIKALQLNHFQRTLLQNRTTISEAALECGISHLGQLSQDYKKLFGELPRKTLQSEIS